jgi:inorganic pyrophosphatase
LGKGEEMSVEKFLENTKKFEIEAYKKFPDLLLDHVPFTGSPQKHPYDKAKIILITDPFSTHTSYYEFNIEDIGGAEELPSMATLEGETVSIFRLWVRKGRIGVRVIPFVIEGIPRGA